MWNAIILFVFVLNKKKYKYFDVCICLSSRCFKRFRRFINFLFYILQGFAIYFLCLCGLLIYLSINLSIYLSIYLSIVLFNCKRAH